MDNKKYTVYAHINKKDNDKIYIGVTSQPVKARWSNGKGYHKTNYFGRAINKYGWDSFEHIILFKGLTKEEAYQKEKDLIQLYDSTNPDKGYNIQTGGQSGPKDFKKMTDWARDPKNKRFGKDNVSSIRVICRETQNVFGSMGEAGRWAGVNSTNISECCRGIRKHAGRHPVNGYLLSWDFTDKEVNTICHEVQQVSKYAIKKVQCIETGEIYNSGAQASRLTGVNASGISGCCHGTQKTAGNLHWKFIEEES